MQVPPLVGVGRVLQTEDPVKEPAGGRRRGLVTAVLAVLVVAGLVAVTVLGWKYGDARQTDRARAQALATAQKAAPVILSYDYRHLDRDFDAARGHLTGSFRDEYRRTTTKVVAPTAKKYKGVVKATVVKPAGGGAPAASVVSASPDRAVVLLFVNQVTSSTQISGPRVDLNRVRMTLTLTSGGWKVSAVDAL
jgi:Mce-associated membrane protein